MILTAAEWEIFHAQHPDAHLLQTAAWGQLKHGFGWEPVWLVNRDTGPGAGAQVLFRCLPLGFSLAYIPKGPFGAELSGLLAEVDTLCRQKRAILLIVEPDIWQSEPAASGSSQVPPASLAVLDSLTQAGFCPGRQTIQPPRTLLVDLQGSEDEILARMKQKTRYNIRLAAKKGVTVRVFSGSSEDSSPDEEVWQRFYALMQTTGKRDQFGVHTLSYYRRAFELFQPSDAASEQHCALLLAEYQGELLAALMVFVCHQTALYLYGASGDAYRSLMPTYLLQWEAMRWARKLGCCRYDLWGVPDEDEDTLEANFETRHEGLWGVYRFKRGFGGQLRRSLGAWEKVYIPALYAIYRRLV